MALNGRINEIVDFRTLRRSVDCRLLLQPSLSYQIELFKSIYHIFMLQF